MFRTNSSEKPQKNRTMNWPALQLVQRAAPDDSENVPGTQASHDVCPWIPVEKPAGQGRQLQTSRHEHDNKTLKQCFHKFLANMPKR
jgi:hypothetical protein